MCLQSQYDFFWRQTATKPYRNLAEIVRKPHSLRVIFTTSAQKSYDARAMSLPVPYNYLKSLPSFLGPNDYRKSCVVLTISLQCPYGIMRSTCDMSTGFQFFKICHRAELNTNVEATMPVNLYDDRTVSLRRPHGKGNLDIVLAS